MDIGFYYKLLPFKIQLEPHKDLKKKTVAHIKYSYYYDYDDADKINDFISTDISKKTYI